MRYVLGDGEGEKLARSNATEATWMLTDRQGSVRELMDNTGAIRRSIMYDGYGNVISSVGDIDTGRFLFASYIYDSATGLSNAHWRWYDAPTGQWATEDPIGFAAGDANIRRYVGNNSTNATDRSGLQTPTGERWTPPAPQPMQNQGSLSGYGGLGGGISGGLGIGSSGAGQAKPVVKAAVKYDLDSIKQGSANDCWYLSAIIALENTRPGSLHNIITDLGGGKYSVALPKTKAVIVDDKPAYGTTSIAIANGGSVFNFAAVLENALLKIDGGDAMGITVLTGKGITKLTGNDRTSTTVFSSFNWSVLPKDTHFKIDTAVRMKRAILASSFASRNIQDEFNHIPGHVFAVIGYDSTRKIVTLRDPHGASDMNNKNPKHRQSNGVFKMSLIDFQRTFTGFVIED